MYEDIQQSDPAEYERRMRMDADSSDSKISSAFNNAGGSALNRGRAGLGAAYEMGGMGERARAIKNTGTRAQLGSLMDAFRIADGAGGSGAAKFPGGGPSVVKTPTNTGFGFLPGEETTKEVMGPNGQMTKESLYAPDDMGMRIKSGADAGRYLSNEWETRDGVRQRKTRSLDPTTGLFNPEARYAGKLSTYGGSSDPLDNISNQTYDGRYERPGYAKGGTVRGPKGIDKVPAMLTAGEAVLPLKTVKALGGPKAVEALIKATNGGKVGGEMKKVKGKGLRMHAAQGDVVSEKDVNWFTRNFGTDAAKQEQLNRVAVERGAATPEQQQSEGARQELLQDTNTPYDMVSPAAVAGVGARIAKLATAPLTRSSAVAGVPAEVAPIASGVGVPATNRAFELATNTKSPLQADYSHEGRMVPSKGSAPDPVRTGELQARMRDARGELPNGQNLDGVSDETQAMAKGLRNIQRVNMRGAGPGDMAIETGMLKGIKKNGGVEYVGDGSVAAKAERDRVAATPGGQAAAFAKAFEDRGYTKDQATYLTQEFLKGSTASKAANAGAAGKVAEKQDASNATLFDKTREALAKKHPNLDVDIDKASNAFSGEWLRAQPKEVQAKLAPMFLNADGSPKHVREMNPEVQNLFWDAFEADRAGRERAEVLRDRAGGATGAAIGVGARAVIPKLLRMAPNPALKAAGTALENSGKLNKFAQYAIPGVGGAVLGSKVDMTTPNAAPANLAGMYGAGRIEGDAFVLPDGRKVPLSAFDALGGQNAFYGLREPPK